MSRTERELTMEDAWLTWAKRLKSIASTGLHFSRDRYDHERYGEIAHIADEMLGSLGSVPVQRIEGLVSDFAKGYATPKIDVRAAVFHEDRILLVREASAGGGRSLAGLRMSACRPARMS